MKHRDIYVWNEYETEALFVYLSPVTFVLKSYPLRLIRTMVDKALAGLIA
jgi:hypothetical protein